MAEFKNADGKFRSPGGFEFGVEGWIWAQPVFKSITFYLDGTAQVSDQYGRPVRGVVAPDGRTTHFAMTPPPARAMDDSDDALFRQLMAERAKLARHAEVIAALTVERVDWTTLACAGWPQLPYEELKKLKRLPPTPIEELQKISDTQLRRAAVRARLEADSGREMESAIIEAEMTAIQAEVETSKAKRDAAMKDLVRQKREELAAGK
jgi:hypothetical protein